MPKPMPAFRFQSTVLRHNRRHAANISVGFARIADGCPVVGGFASSARLARSAVAVSIHHAYRQSHSEG